MILITGAGPLAEAIEQRLREMGVAVERIQPDASSGRLPHESFKHAAALILAADDDAGNVNLALQTRQTSPALPWSCACLIRCCCFLTPLICVTWTPSILCGPR